MKKKLIDLYADGIQLNEFNKDYGIEIDGYTFNPSLFRSGYTALICCYRGSYSPSDRCFNNIFFIYMDFKKFTIRAQVKQKNHLVQHRHYNQVNHDKSEMHQDLILHLNQM